MLQKIARYRRALIAIGVILLIPLAGFLVLRHFDGWLIDPRSDSPKDGTLTTLCYSGDTGSGDGTDDVYRVHRWFAFAWLEPTVYVEPETRTVSLGTKLPMLAVWRDPSSGICASTSYLHIAIWEDGRILFTPNPQKWNAPLYEGSLTPAQVTELKTHLKTIHVFELKETRHTGIDGEVECAIVQFGGKKQILYWDEFYSKYDPPTDEHDEKYLPLKRSWEGINILAQKYRPECTRSVSLKFYPPYTWSMPSRGKRE